MFEKSEFDNSDGMQSSDIVQKGLTFLKTRNAMLVIALLVGILIGVFFGWQVWPVQWTDANVEHLRLDLQTEWVRLVAYGYGNGLIDEVGVTARLDALGESATDAYLGALADPQSDRTSEALNYIQKFYELDLSGIDAPDTTDTTVEPVVDDAVEEESGGTFGKVLLWGGIILAVLLVSGAVVYYLSNREQEDIEHGSSLSSYLSEQFGSNEITEETSETAARSDAPLNQWMTTYVKGDDLFDDSFSIDAPTGEFLGECGVGIADTIGVGDPKKVSAFEVWLFDKNDIQTVTKVLMSNHLFDDDHSRNRLAAKGEPILAEAGQELTLETATLQMNVRVVDIAYGQGALPDNSYFDRITLELTVWEK
jgi:hypothetical protein